MLHYSSREWLLYKDGFLLEKTRRAMEDHLRICEACLDNYLSTFEPRDEVAASGFLPPDFPVRVTGRVTEMCARRKNWSRLDCNWVAKTIQYYTIAAAITLLLLVGGWFDFLASGAIHSQVRVATLAETVDQKIPFGWSERLVENASGRLAMIIKIKEGTK